MNNLSKKVAIYGLSALIGLTSLFGGFKYELNTQQIENPTQAGQVVKGAKLKNIAKSFKFGPTAAYAMEKGVFQAPSLEGYMLGKTYSANKDEVTDGIKETTIERFINAAGQKILKYTTNGKTWAWGIIGNPNNTASTANYVIRNSNCSGQFNEKYNASENFYLPQCNK